MSTWIYLHELVFFSDLFGSRGELEAAKAFSINRSMTFQITRGIFSGHNCLFEIRIPKEIKLFEIQD